MQEMKVSHELQLDAARSAREHAVAVAQVARDMDACERVRGKWVKEFATEQKHALPAHGLMPKQLASDRPHWDVAKPIEEHIILKRPPPLS